MTIGTLTLLAAVAAGPLVERVRAELPALVAALGSPRFAERDAAGRRLRGFGELVLPAVREAARVSPDLEVRERSAGVRDVIERELYRLLHTLDTDGQVLYAVAISPDGREAVTGGRGGSLHVYDLWAGRRVRVVPFGRQVNAVAYRPDGRRFAFAGRDGAVHLWAADPPAAARSATTGDADGLLFTAAFTPDSRRLIVGTQSGRLKVLDTDTLVLERMVTAHQAAVWHIAVAADGKRVATASDDGTVGVWDAATWERQHTLRGNGEFIYNVAFVPGRPAVVAVGGDGRVRVWAYPR